MLQFLAETRLEKSLNCSHCNRVITGHQVEHSNGTKTGCSYDHNNTNIVKVKEAAPPVENVATRNDTTYQDNTSNDKTTSQVTDDIKLNDTAGKKRAASSSSPKKVPTKRRPNSKAEDKTPTTVRKLKPRQTFDERLIDLISFKASSGHCTVPYLYQGESPNGEKSSLGEWVKDIRRGHLKVTKQQRQQLSMIGFNWETYRNKREREWNQILQKLESYKLRHGDCCVPSNYEQDKKLYEWIHTQRKQNNKGALRADRKEKLALIGFEWGATARK
eukprot:CAMPEP_0119008424 /NCGR_PEP_ID=MMETSP1176-20130426/3682_1 /TAXON_ID=265551 /ORGANISM="Synedropsis recta cf, Strain CCMP1620" /LENGTH=273 /DNA_ID=CAMNT_0006960751 /DNA_START=440 /DNA_END=1261 /DNA_ORIENTATION=+